MLAPLAHSLVDQYRGSCTVSTCMFYIGSWCNWKWSLTPYCTVPLQSACAITQWKRLSTQHEFISSEQPSILYNQSALKKNLVSFCVVTSHSQQQKSTAELLPSVNDTKLELSSLLHLRCEVQAGICDRPDFSLLLCV